MIVTKIEGPKEFTPITLSITIENQAELEALSQMSGYNFTNTDAMVEHGSLGGEYRNVVQNFLSDIYSIIG